MRSVRRSAPLPMRSWQRALQNEAWGQVPIRVRMGLHSGAAVARDGEYIGYLTLARVQRIMSVAHGGQALLSSSAAELVLEHLSAGISLRDLGEHRLKGLSNSEYLWQVVAPDLPQDFPLLASLNAIPNNLPTQLTSFVGREKELVELKYMLHAKRLLTLTGSGGTDKTRLSLQVAAEALDTFRDGVWFIELAALADPALVAQAVAASMGVQEKLGRALLDVLIDYLRPKQLLLIFDNCEHLLEACAQLADKLLRSPPQLEIMTSSREALGIAGETVYRVPSLSLVEENQAPDLNAIMNSECVRLFAERASSAQSSFRLTEQNAPSVGQICRRLDGIPLAVELAAARVKVFAPAQIAARLDNRFGLLTGGSRTALPRQQTLRALIDCSYDLLNEPERMLLRRLSVFSNGWTFEAAEGVCAGEGIETGALLDLLAHLVEKSVVVVEESDPSGARHRLLETIRQYARDKFLDSGESAGIRNNHLAFFLGFAEEAEPHLFSPSMHVRYVGRSSADWMPVSGCGRLRREQCGPGLSTGAALWNKGGQRIRSCS